jgi:hypothetical protein
MRSQILQQKNADALAEANEEHDKLADDGELSSGKGVATALHTFVATLPPPVVQIEVDSLKKKLKMIPINFKTADIVRKIETELGNMNLTLYIENVQAGILNSFATPDALMELEQIRQRNGERYMQQVTKIEELMRQLNAVRNQ